MTNELEAFREKLKADREKMAAQDGNVCLCGDKGPVGFELVEVLFRIVEAQQSEIERINRELRNL